MKQVKAIQHSNLASEIFDECHSCVKGAPKTKKGHHQSKITRNAISKENNFLSA
jgi:hypothetical protein